MLARHGRCVGRRKHKKANGVRACLRHQSSLSLTLACIFWLSLCSVCIFAEPGRRSAFVTTHVALGGRRGSIFGPRNSHVLGGEGELARVLAATRGRWDVLECFGTLLRACADPRGSGRREWLIPCSQLSRAAPSAGGARPPPAAGGSPRRLSSRRLMAEPGAFRAAVRAGAQCLCGAAAAAPPYSCAETEGSSKLSSSAAAPLRSHSRTTQPRQECGAFGAWGVGRGPWDCLGPTGAARAALGAHIWSM